MQTSRTDGLKPSCSLPRIGSPMRLWLIRSLHRVEASLAYIEAAKNQDPSFDAYFNDSLTMLMQRILHICLSFLNSHFSFSLLLAVPQKLTLALHLQVDSLPPPATIGYKGHSPPECSSWGFSFPHRSSREEYPDRDGTHAGSRDRHTFHHECGSQLTDRVVIGVANLLVAPSGHTAVRET